jgi:glutathione peroxidase
MFSAFGATEFRGSAAVDGRRIIAGMSNFYDFKVNGLDGQADLLAGLKGKVVLAVNVASQCNQFGAQEPGSAKEIRTFCSANYGISFPISAKLEVNGPGRHPLYAWLTDPANGHAGDIQWNFEKFLIGRDGRLLNRYVPTVKPRDAGIMNDIAAAL